MDYEDFKREWIVTEFESDAKCTKGQIVTFDGPATAVTVKCDEETPYGEGTGMYVRELHRIEVADSKIVKTAPRQIRFDAGRSIGGSWTAEDNTGETGAA
jgi:hypothetical protein